MITVQIKVTDGDEVVVNVTAVVPDLWVAAGVLNKTSDLIGDYVEVQNANKELQE